MASGFSIYTANRLLDKQFRRVDFTPESTVYAGLFKNASAAGYLRSGDVASAQEVLTAGGTLYARVPITLTGGTAFSVAASGHTENAAEIVFPQAGASWGTVYTVALMDVATVNTGNVIVYADLPASKVIGSPDVPKIPIYYFDIYI